jgi:hypothetical protein
MPTHRLVSLTLCYLFLPVLLFLWGWTYPWVAAPLSVLLGWTVWLLGHPIGSEPASPPLSSLEQIGLLLASVGLLLVSGIGAFTGQLGDYAKHNQLLVDLVRNPWPVTYPAATGQPFLCYYLAYYLPTAGLASLLNVPLRWVDALSVPWGWAGIWLSLRWAVQFSGRYRVWVAVGLLMVAGIEIPYRLGPWLWAETGGTFSGWWAALHSKAIFQYSPYVPPRFFFSNRLWPNSLTLEPLLYQLQQTPQHAFPAWLGASLWLHWQRTQRPLAGWLLVGVAGLLWSPFVVIGLVVLTGWEGRKRWQSAGWQRTQWVLLAVVLGLLLVLATYLMAHAPLAFVGLTTDAWQTPTDGLLHVGLLLLNVGLPVGLLWVVCRSVGTFWPRWATGAAVGIALCSLVYVGVFNDFFTRTSMPLQWVLGLALLNGLLAAWHVPGARKRLSVWLLTGWVVVGAFMPLRLLGYTLWALRFSKKDPLSVATTAQKQTDITQLKGGPYDPPAHYAAQYLGQRESWFATYLMSTPLPTAPPVLR